tara:strand:+ start:648 stop:1412 length:765 start_codon:yes stop_codon:yes gene_type:complete
MDTTAIRAQVATMPSLAQVVEAAPGGFDVPVDSGAELYSLFAPLVENRVYPVTAGEDQTLSQIVYTIVGSDSLELEGYRITQTDRYVLTLRSATYDALISLINAVVTAVRTSAFAIDLIDWETGHEPKYTTDGAFRADLEVDFTYVVDAAGGPADALATALPLAVVYPVGRFAEESNADNLIHQKVTNQYAIVLVALAGQMPGLLAELQTALLGFQQASDFHDMEYISGSNLGGVGPMEMWREQYQDYNYIRET